MTTDDIEKIRSEEKNKLAQEHNWQKQEEHYMEQQNHYVEQQKHWSAQQGYWIGTVIIACTVMLSTVVLAIYFK